MFGSIFGRGDKKKMSERQQILEMLASGKITVPEAEKLLNAIGDDVRAKSETTAVATSPKAKAKFLRVSVSGSESEKVEIRVPLQLLRAGVKLASVIPANVQGKIDSSLQEKGIDFSLSDVKPETIEELIDALSEMSIDVADGGEGDSVRIFCE